LWPLFITCWLSSDQEAPEPSAPHMRWKLRFGSYCTGRLTYRLRPGQFFWFICKILAHRAPPPRPVHNAFRMFAPKCFCDMAAPANGQMRFKYVLKFFGRNLAPLHGFLFRAQQSGPVIMPVDFLDRLTAIRARSAAVPLLGNTPHRAAFRIVFNLAETLLFAALALWPARTLVEMNSCVFAP
jgi:hypothetical protein